MKKIMCTLSVHVQIDIEDEAYKDTYSEEPHEVLADLDYEFSLDLADTVSTEIMDVDNLTVEDDDDD